MKIRNFFGFIGFGLMIALVILFWQVYQLEQITHSLARLEHQRFDMHSKSDELRQSSDDLTRLARTYVITGDPRYREDYFQVLAIRNGEAPRPRDYSASAYWDLPVELRQQRHPPQIPESLAESLARLPFTSSEKARLAEAERQSNQLVALEVQAFRAMEGLFQDNDGEYTVRAPPDQALAIELLHSPEYHRAKARIMLPIDSFMESLNQRTEQQIQATEDRQRRYFIQLFILAGMAGLLIGLIFHATRRKILMPVESLSQAVIQAQHDPITLPEGIFYQDEIGLLAERFLAMKQQMDHDYQIMEQMAFSDYLTGARNRRYFFESGEQLLALHQRNRDPLCLALLDIDFFKRINDTHGHPVGDQVLRQLSLTCQATVRRSDLFARLGGEEFAILYPGMASLECQPLLERLRAQIESDGYQNPQQRVSYTISIGVAQSRPGDSLSALLSRADQALYQAKTGGRNQVRAAGGEAGSWQLC